MLRPHTPSTEPVPVESSSEKKVRYFLAAVYFLQVILTTTPFLHNVTEAGELQTISALQLVLQLNGFTGNSFFLAIIGGLLILLPITAFFFCVLDKRSRVKYIACAACAVICAVLITFSIGPKHISIGAVITLIINVVTLFFTMQGFQATSKRMIESNKLSS